MAHLTDRRPSTEVRADLPAAIDEVIAQGMAKDPAQRPASASELMLKARRALGAGPAEADRRPPPPTRPGCDPPSAAPTRAPHTAAKERPGCDPPCRRRGDSAGRCAHTRRRA